MAPLFERGLDHGLCVAVRLPVDEGDESAGLAPEERAHALGLPPARRRTWAGGRAAMRLAAGRLGVELGPVMTDDRGAPALPAGVGLVGSISHKEDVAVALLAAAEANGARVGVDVEREAPRKVDVSRKVLREEELVELAAMPEADRGREVLLRFSLKEAVYKAIDPFVRRYVGFGEVVVRPAADGRAGVTLALAAGEGPFVVEARWQRVGDLLVTTAKAWRS